VRGELKENEMTLDSELDLRHAYESLAKMYQLCDRLKADTTGGADTRADEVESVKMMIRKVDKQIAAYYAAHPERGGGITQSQNN
jgi:hypothetical protein